MITGFLILEQFQVSFIYDNYLSNTAKQSKKMTIIPVQAKDCLIQYSGKGHVKYTGVPKSFGWERREVGALLRNSSPPAYRG